MWKYFTKQYVVGILRVYEYSYQGEQVGTMMVKDGAVNVMVDIPHKLVLKTSFPTVKEAKAFVEALVDNTFKGGYYMARQ